MRALKSTSKNLTRSLVPVALCVLIFSGCGRGFQSQSASETKSFTDGKTKSRYRVELQRPEFIESTDATSVKAKATSDKTLAEAIKNFRIDIGEAPSDKVSLAISMLDRSKIEFESQISVTAGSAKSKSKIGFQGRSKNALFDVTAVCAEISCDHASIILTELGSKKFIQAEYSRSTEYLKPEDVGGLKISAEDKALLKDVIEYHLPITRHAAKIAGRNPRTAIVDLLIVERPEVDVTDESYDEDSIPGADGSQPEIPSEPEIEIPSEHMIELEATSSIAETPGDSQVMPSMEKDSGNGDEGASSLSLTSNPYEVYNLVIPKDRFKNLGEVRNPLQLANFEIVPAEAQKMHEPAYRIAVLAEAFVNQKVKIYRNACNIYVRAVMTLAGYTKGKSPRANDYEQLFDTKGQGLDRWERYKFSRGSTAAETAIGTNSLQAAMNALPEGYAIVAQFKRARIGHVGFVAKLDGVVYMMDGSLNKISRGLHKTPVNAKQLMSPGRPNLTLYGIRGIIKNKNRSI